MKNVELTVEISKPAKFVFDFAINPVNTPKWIDGIFEEVTNEQPVKKGTIYKNRRKGGKWKTYVMSEFSPPKSFVMSEKDGEYHVKYIVTPTSDSTCRLVYQEYVDSGQIDEPFTIDILEKLKQIIESE